MTEAEVPFSDEPEMFKNHPAIDTQRPLVEEVEAIMRQYAAEHPQPGDNKALLEFRVLHDLWPVSLTWMQWRADQIRREAPRDTLMAAARSIDNDAWVEPTRQEIVEQLPDVRLQLAAAALDAAIEAEAPELKKEPQRPKKPKSKPKPKPVEPVPLDDSDTQYLSPITLAAAHRFDKGSSKPSISGIYHERSLDTKPQNTGEIRASNAIISFLQTNRRVSESHLIERLTGAGFTQGQAIEHIQRAVGQGIIDKHGSSYRLK